MHVRLGDVTPADVEIAEGTLHVDQSTLTGESLPVDRAASETIYAGSVVVRGEASGVVTATGSRTYHGRTAELVKTARTVSHLESVIMRIVRALIALDLVLALVVGIAVAGATDVAKAAASLVLTSAGLGGIVAAVQASRRIHQRMLTYALNASIKKLEIPPFLSVVLLTTGRLALTPVLMVLLLFANDIATMAITTDSVAFARRPDRWPMPQLLLGAAGVALPLLTGILVVYWVGPRWLDLPQLRTLTFLAFVFTSQATIDLVREPRRLWSSRPSRTLIAATAAGVCIAVALAPLPLPWALALLAAVAAYAVMVDGLKVHLFRLLRLHET